MVQGYDYVTQKNHFVLAPGFSYIYTPIQSNNMYAHEQRLHGHVACAHQRLPPWMSYLARNSSQLSLLETLGHYHFIAVQPGRLHSEARISRRQFFFTGLALTSLSPIQLGFFFFSPFLASRLSPPASCSCNNYSDRDTKTNNYSIWCLF